MSEKTRPRTIEEMHRRLQLLEPDGAEQAKAARRKAMSVKLRPTDVVITPFGKSGTTWTQQIVHTLRTRGDMDFDDISRVIPWIEVNGLMGLDLDAEQRANPRAFKSHLDWDSVPKGGRYINVVRDPGDVAVSLFKFEEGWFLEPGAVGVDEFVRSEFLSSRGYFKHLLSWWPRRNDPDVLFLCYERMLITPRSTIERIAEFIGIELDTELLDLTERHASIEFMLEHKDRFDDAMFRRISEDRAGLPHGSDSAKVREGKAGAKGSLSAEVQAEIEQAWHEEITAILGFENYAALLTALDDRAR